MAMVYVPSDYEPAPGEVKAIKDKEIKRALGRIAIASDSGQLVQTEAATLMRTEAWKTNLLKQGGGRRAVPVMDPMLIPRQYSDSELRALYIPARKLRDKSSGGAQPSPSSSADKFLPPIQLDAALSVQDSVVQMGILAALHLERQLKQRIRQSFETGDGSEIALTLLSPGCDDSEAPSPYRPLSAYPIETNLEGSLGLGSGDEVTLQRQQQGGSLASSEPFGGAQPTPPITPFVLHSPQTNPMQPKSHLLRTFEDIIRDSQEEVQKPPSPLEQSTRLRRYKLGLSPMQKVKNMLDDLTARYPQSGGAPNGRPAAPNHNARPNPNKGSGAGAHHAAHPSRRTHVVKLVTAGKGNAMIPNKEAILTDTIADFEERSFGQGDVAGDCDDVVFVGGRLETFSFVSQDSLSLSHASPGPSLGPSIALSELPSPDLFQAPVWIDESDDKSVDSAALRRSVTLEPLEPNKHAKEKIDIGHRERLQKVKAARAVLAETGPVLPSAAAHEAADLLFSCSRCAQSGKLWCHGCKLAFCYTCWGLVDHHRAEDGVQAMAAESRLFLTASDGWDDGGPEPPEDAKVQRLKQPVVYARSAAKGKGKAGPREEPPRMAPTLLEFDEANASHFAAEKKDPERVKLLLDAKIKRLGETSSRTKNIIRMRRNQSDVGEQLAQRRQERVSIKVDRQRQRELEVKLAQALEEESTVSSLANMPLGKPSKVQRSRERIAHSSQSRSPSPTNFRTHIIRSPINRKQDEAEDIAKLYDDPVAGWGWNDMGAKAARNKNYSELPFTPVQDLEWVLPDHIKEMRSKTPSTAQVQAVSKVGQAGSLW